MYFHTLILFILRSRGANIFFRSFKTRLEAAGAPAAKDGRAEGARRSARGKAGRRRAGGDARLPADRAPRRRARRAGPDPLASSVRGRPGAARRAAEAGTKRAPPHR